MLRLLVYIVLFSISSGSIAQIKMGAERFDSYKGDVANKRVALVGNHSTMIGATHVVDMLISRKVNLVKIFSPEHGFRGNADAGKVVKSSVDEKTGLPIISLYGSGKKPTKDQLSGVDIVLFDIQDVGARFYTYISTMSYVMEACAESNIPVIVLDRPNPNGHFVDGPVLEPGFESFVGMHQVPIVHGMTVGEYAKMVNSEGWLKGSVKCNLKVITCEGYTHSTYYQLPIKPSPNLPNMSSVYLYPTLCLFESTYLSVGRGTDKPFQVVGHPKMKGRYTFTPKPIAGASSNPKWKGVECTGYDLSTFGTRFLPDYGKLYLFWMINIYQDFPNKDKFFKPFFDKLAGTKKLCQQIQSGMKEEDIRKSWQEDLLKFKIIRKKYLLYKDFE